MPEPAGGAFSVHQTHNCIKRKVNGNGFEKKRDKNGGEGK